MDALIAGLPQNETSGTYRFEVIYDSETEGNVYTTAQVAAAKAKGWMPYHFDTSLKKWVEYAGTDPSDIEGVLIDTDKDAPIYNLNGQRLNEPRKGINIIGGKKVVVK